MKCRLCLNTGNLLDVFDSRFTRNGQVLRKYIHLCAGVEIVESDTISKKICKLCLDHILNMYKFRSSATNNDKKLKNAVKSQAVTEKPLSEIIKEHLIKTEKIAKTVIQMESIEGDSQNNEGNTTNSMEKRFGL